MDKLTEQAGRYAFEQLELFGAFGLVVVLLVAWIVVAYIDKREMRRAHQQDRDNWVEERKQLDVYNRQIHDKFMENANETTRIIEGLRTLIEIKFK